MLHRRHHSGIGAVLLALAGALALAACQGAPDLATLRIGPIPQPGLLFDHPPPPVSVVRDGPAGELIAGAAPPLVPQELVDEAVAESLRPWLTAIERRQLAEASQRAAAEFTLQPVAWEAHDPSGARTAAGAVVAVNNVYYAVRGYYCRDVRQSVAKGNEQHQDQVTLCRRDFGAGNWVWVIGEGDQ